MYALCKSTLSGGLQAETMASGRSFLKHYTDANIQLNKVCTLWKYSGCWASSTSKGSQKKFFETLYTFKHTIEQCMRSVKVNWMMGFKQKQWLAEEYFQNIIHIQKHNWTAYALCEISLRGWLQAEAMAFRRNSSTHYTHWNIKLNKICPLWKYSECWASSTSNVFQTNFFETLYTFKHTLEQSMPSVKVHWVVGFKQKQWVSAEFFQNIIHIQTYNWTMYALCKSTLSGGLQAEAMGSTRIFLKHYTHANVQLNKVCALRKYTDCLASSRRNGFQKKFFKTFYIFKRTIKQIMHSLKVQWVLGFKHKQRVSEEIFWNIIHIQTCNWTKYPICESTLSGGLQAEVMASRRSFLKHYTHANIQLNKVCILWKYTEWWASSRSNGWQKKFFETLYTCKHTIEQSMHSVKVHWVVGLKQKQWVSEEVFQNLIHIQTYNWTKFALCENTLSGGLQAEVVAFRKSFSKHYTYSNIQLNRRCTLWKCAEWWSSSRSNGFQKNIFKTLYKFKQTIEQGMHSVKLHWAVGLKQKQWVSEEIFKTLYTFKYTIEQCMRSVKVHWVLGFKQKQWLAEEVFWIIIHIQTYNWTKYALCESTVSGGLQAEAMGFRTSFSKHYTYSRIQLNKLCALWKYTEQWASSRSNGLQKKFFKTLQTFKHTIERSMRSVKVHWVVGFKQK